MQEERGGLLPAQTLRAMIEAKQIDALAPISQAQIQPASLDLRLGDTAYRVRASFLPSSRMSVEDKLAAFGLHEIPLSDGAVLETGCVYVVPLQERLNLPSEISAAANPKSSTGRLDVFTRIITETGTAFDQIPAGYDGPLYAEICPQTFPVLVRPGSLLTQIRFRRGRAAHTDTELALLHGEHKLVSSETADIDEGIALSVDLASSGGDVIIGYRAKRHTGVVDMDRPGAYPVDEFWEPIPAQRQNRLILDPDQFYILASKEAVHVPPTHAAEMMPFNPLVGEFRVHYAGFLDPGFGHEGAGGAGSRVVLEVRSHKVPFILEDGQIVGRVIYERLTERPDQVYGEGIGSNYQAQGLKLSKHFRLT
ncbi:MAG: 2'-deoxycytidine 5'-triphosphate deaminase [Hyphomicrobiales bacterium]|nr:2'-deoxycytidine 5'-triphosphate deaminase [Hyphomicrobiales bacterium]